MEPKSLDPNLENALCRLVSLLTNYPIEALDEFDKLNNLKPLGFQIDEIFFGPRMANKEVTWESFCSDLEEYLESLDVYNGLFIDEGADLVNPSTVTIMNILRQVLAVHWLCSPRIEEELPSLEDSYRQTIIDSVGPHRTALAEEIAREVISSKKENLNGVASLERSSSLHKASIVSTASSTNRILLSKMNDKDKQLETGVSKIRKMEDYIESLKIDIGNACAKNDELELISSKLQSENQRLKTEQRYQKNRQMELEAGLEREKADRELTLEKLAAESVQLSKMKQELTIYIEKVEEYTRLLTLESTYRQYLEERTQFMQAKSEMKDTIHELVMMNEQGRTRMNDLSKLCGEQEAKLKTETQRVMKLEQENLFLANENQQLKVEVNSYNKLFNNESLNKRKGDSRLSPKPTSNRGTDETEAFRGQISRLKVENSDLKKKLMEEEREFRKELDGALEVHKRQAQLLEEARIEAASSHQALLELKEGTPRMRDYSIPEEGSGVFHGLRSLGVEGTEAQVQVGPELLEKKEIDTNYLVYSAVMEFMGGHMEHFRDSQLRQPSSKNQMANFFSGGRLKV
jgi:hypothetical protein